MNQNKEVNDVREYPNANPNLTPTLVKERNMVNIKEDTRLFISCIHGFGENKTVTEYSRH